MTRFILPRFSLSHSLCRYSDKTFKAFSQLQSFMQSQGKREGIVNCNLIKEKDLKVRCFHCISFITGIVWTFKETLKIVHVKSIDIWIRCLKKAYALELQKISDDLIQLEAIFFRQVNRSTIEIMSLALTKKKSNCYRFKWTL